MIDFQPNTTIKSNDVDTNFTGLSDGSLDTPNNSMANFRSESVADFVAAGLTIATSSSLASTIAAGVAYCKGVRLTPTNTPHTFSASKDTYIDLDSAGNYYYVEVANGATSGMTLTTNAVRIAKVVTNSTNITSVTQASTDPLGNYIYNLSPIRFAKEEAWIYATYQNSWVTYDVAFTAARYMKDSLGFVHINGMVKNGTIGAAVFTLPVGYRPSGQTLLFGTHSQSGAGRVDVSTAGLVVINAPANNIWTTLDGITFKAEQ